MSNRKQNTARPLVPATAKNDQFLDPKDADKILESNFEFVLGELVSNRFGSFSSAALSTMIVNNEIENKNNFIDIMVYFQYELFSLIEFSKMGFWLRI